MRSKRELVFGALRGFAAILIAIGVAAVLIFITSDEPGTALYYLLINPITELRQIYGILERMIPYIFTGLAVCVMFQANQFNLAGEGACMLGGFVAALGAIYLQLPPALHITVCILMGMVAAGLAMLIPALLNTWLGANVMVSSLMLNYIIMYVCNYFLSYHFADRTQGATMSHKFQQSAMIPKMFPRGSASYGLVIGLVMVVIVSIFMYRTRWGYSIRMVGINPKFSLYSGMKVAGIIVLCQVIGGMLAGMGGAVEMIGYYDRYKWRSLPGYGWNGVTLAILTKNNPAYIPIAAFFLAYLYRGCVQMSIYSDVPAELIEVIQAVIFLFFAAEFFLAKYRQKIVVKNAMEEIEEEQKVNTSIGEGADA